MRPRGAKDFSPAFCAAVIASYQTMKAGAVAKLFGLRSKTAVYGLVRRHAISTIIVDNPVRFPVFHSTSAQKRRLTNGQDGNAGV